MDKDLPRLDQSIPKINVKKTEVRFANDESSSDNVDTSETQNLIDEAKDDIEMTPRVRIEDGISQEKPGDVGDRSYLKRKPTRTASSDTEQFSNTELKSGDIEFRGITRDTKARYIVLDEKTSADDAWDRMKEKWDIEEPSWIVSVIGGSRAFHLDDRIESSFKKTIKKLSKLPNAYIITGGVYSGVMKLVGDSMELDDSSKTTCLGISSWDEVQDKEKFMDENNTSPYVVGTWLSRIGLYLDYQHTNFIIVKEKEDGDKNGQTKFRAALEKKLKRLSGAKPSILLVVNGGFGTLEFVKEYIEQVNEKVDGADTYPDSCIVLLENSGKCASLLSNAYEILKDVDNIENIVKDIEKSRLCDQDRKLMEALWSNFKKYMIDPEDKRYDNVEWRHMEAKMGEPMDTEADRAKMIDDLMITSYQVGNTHFDSVDWETPIQPFEPSKSIQSIQPIRDIQDIQPIQASGSDSDAIFIQSIQSIEPIEPILPTQRPTKSTKFFQSFQTEFQRFPSVSEKLSSLAYAFKNLLRCMSRKELFTVAGLSTKVDIDTAVLKGLLAGQKSTFEKMELTLRYDRADFAESEIFPSNPMLKVEDLQKLIILALNRGDHAYVKLLMDYGVNMHDLLTEKVLEELYGYQLFEGNFLLMKKVRGLMQSNEWQLHKSSEHGVRRKLLKKHVQELLSTLCDRFGENEVGVFNFQNDIKSDDWSPKLEDPFWELFIWAVICNMPEMADFLWPFGRDQLAKALIGAEVFEQLSKVRGIYQQAALSTKQFSMKYRTMAQDLLDELSATNEKFNRRLVTRTLQHIPEMTCIDIAVQTNHYEFVAHSSVQMILWDVWTGSMKTKVVKPFDYLQFFISIIFPWSLIASPLISSQEDNESTPGEEDNGFLTRLKNFYFYTPIVAFLLHLCGATVFLAVYSYTVISGQCMHHGAIKNLSPYETYLVLYMIGYVVGEIYQITNYDGRITTKLTTWKNDSKNMFDILNCALFFFAFVLGFFADTRAFSHTLYSINCGLWIIRFSLVVRVFSKLGLYFEMMTTMLVDLMWFLVILGVFITAFGVTATSLLYPGKHEPLKYLHMFLRSWFSIYGEYFMEINPEGNSTHLTSPQINSYDEYVVIIVMGLYLLLTNILLLNIIIASFNTTYANIQEKSKQISKYRIYDLVFEYSHRVSTPPPLSLLHHIIKLLAWIVRKCRKVEPPDFPFMHKLKRYRGDIAHLPEDEAKDERRNEGKLRDFEYYCAVKVFKGETKGAAVTDYLEDSQTPQMFKKIEQLQQSLSHQVENPYNNTQLHGPSPASPQPRTQDFSRTDALGFTVYPQTFDVSSEGMDILQRMKETTSAHDSGSHTSLGYQTGYQDQEKRAAELDSPQLRTPDSGSHTSLGYQIGYQDQEKRAAELDSPQLRTQESLQTDALGSPQKFGSQTSFESHLKEKEKKAAEMERISTQSDNMMKQLEKQENAIAEISKLLKDKSDSDNMMKQLEKQENAIAEILKLLKDKSDKEDIPSKSYITSSSPSVSEIAL